VVARATRHLKLNRERLRILGDGMDPFCPLTDVEMGRGMQSMGRWLGRIFKTVGTVSSVALAPVVVMTGGPPPSSSLTEEALIRCVDGMSLGDYGS
jgi:hypothetical protein